MTAGAIFSAIAGLIKAIPIVDGWFQQIIAAWMALQNRKTHEAIIDAAVMAAHAVTPEDRFKASEAWQRALQRPRQ